MFVVLPVPGGEGAKPELQALLLGEIGLVRDPPPDQQDGHPESDPEAEEPLVEEPPQLATVRTCLLTLLSGHSRTTPFPHRAD